MAKITLEESDVISIAQLYSMHSVSLSHYNTTIMARMSEEAEDFYIRRLHIRTSKTNNKKTIWPSKKKTFSKIEVVAKSLLLLAIIQI